MIVRSLGQAAIVFGLGLVLTIVARKRPHLAGAVALIVMTADLAAANARYVLTVPQSVFETKPEVLKIIEDAERADPSPGPFRIHRMPLWNPLGWSTTASKDRIYEMVVVGARHDPAEVWNQPGGRVHTYTRSRRALRLRVVLQRFSLEEFATPRSPGAWASSLEEEVVYFPRRAYDMWNTRYFIVPFTGTAAGATRTAASPRSCFGTERIYPDPDRFSGPECERRSRRTGSETSDFRIMRNLQEFPRAWVVHDARATIPFTGLSPETRKEAMQEILYAGGPDLERRNAHRAYDPRRLAWVGSDDLNEIRGHLSGKTTRPSETVKVSYPSPQQAVLEVTLDSPGLVVLADIYYPGWELTIDGKPAPIYRVNGVMRGAVVSAGHHRLVFTYAPRSFRVGLVVSIAGLGVLPDSQRGLRRWPVDHIDHRSARNARL